MQEAIDRHELRDRIETAQRHVSRDIPADSHTGKLISVFFDTIYRELNATKNMVMPVAPHYTGHETRATDPGNCRVRITQEECPFCNFGKDIPLSRQFQGEAPTT